MSLNQILENDVFEWIGETDERIYTEGKIIKKQLVQILTFT